MTVKNVLPTPERVGAVLKPPSELISPGLMAREFARLYRQQKAIISGNLEEFTSDFQNEISPHSLKTHKGLSLFLFDVNKLGKLNIGDDGLAATYTLLNIEKAIREIFPEQAKIYRTMDGEFAVIIRERKVWYIPDLISKVKEKVSKMEVVGPRPRIDQGGTIYFEEQPMPGYHVTIGAGWAITPKCMLKREEYGTYVAIHLDNLGKAGVNFISTTHVLSGLPSTSNGKMAEISLTELRGLLRCSEQRKDSQSLAYAMTKLAYARLQMDKKASDEAEAKPI